VPSRHVAFFSFIPQQARRPHTPYAGLPSSPQTAAQERRAHQLNYRRERARAQQHTTHAALAAASPSEHKPPTRMSTRSRRTHTHASAALSPPLPLPEDGTMRSPSRWRTGALRETATPRRGRSLNSPTRCEIRAIGASGGRLTARRSTRAPCPRRQSRGCG